MQEGGSGEQWMRADLRSGKGCWDTDLVADDRVWQATDRTGGPWDGVLDVVRQHYPALSVQRLAKTHPGDDDNVYFLGIGQIADIVQVDTRENGRPPFIIEADDRVDTSDPSEAVAAIRDRLDPAR